MKKGLNSKIDICRVEISQFNNGKEFLAIKNIKKDEVVYSERSEVFHEITTGLPRLY